MNTKAFMEDRVFTAVLLAAGTGSRLFPLTQHEPKCMTLVNRQSILERMVSSLIHHGFKRLVIVTGHLDHCIRKYLGNMIGRLKIEYVFSPLYKTTNNIYSLWMARETVQEPFLLLESDLIYDESLLDDMIFPDRLAVARIEPWMNGTCVKLNKINMVEKFIIGKKELNRADFYKTVNIYSFSILTWEKVRTGLDYKIAHGHVKDYYETVFADLVAEGQITFKAVRFDQKPWYEIDTLEDLAEAEKMFPDTYDARVIDLAR